MNSQRFSLISFIISSALIVFNLGYFAREYKLFPYQLYSEAAAGWKKIRSQSSQQLPWYYIRQKEPVAEVNSDSKPYPGLTLVTKMATNRQIVAEIIDLEGKTVHKWDIDWFEIWKDAKHLPENDIPQEKPGTNIHGAIITENGDLIFNFESLGLVRLDRNGKVVWRLSYQTHHSIHPNDKGNLWVSGSKYHAEKDARFPHLTSPFYEETLLEITPEGKIVRELSVGDILRKNGYEGLLYLGSLTNESTRIKSDGLRLGNSDLLHLNDVEPFSSKLGEGFFKQGDLLVSLRNINTVFVFNVETEKIKHISIGQFIRQHDPDFIDGNSFSVFDNNNNGNPDSAKRQSRIAIVSAPDNTVKTYFTGTKDKPFFTNVMGKHQWLPNGNLLITESKRGRGFEINKQGEIVWQYINYVDRDIVGLVGEVQRLSPERTKLFLNRPSTSN